MIRLLSILALFVGSLTISTIVQAQTTEGPLPVDVSVTYVAERAKIAFRNCGCFWLQGGSVDGSVTIYRGLGAAVNFTGEHSSGIISGVDLNKLSFVAGPRYTLTTGRWTDHFLGSRHGTNIFAEALFGYAHGFDSLFPTSTGGTKTSANAFSMQIGGGLNIRLARGFALRAFQIDYVRTNFPNTATNSQNDLRIAVGVAYRLRKP